MEILAPHTEMGSSRRCEERAGVVDVVGVGGVPLLVEALDYDRFKR